MIFKPLRISPSQPAVKSLGIITVTDTIHRPTSNKHVLTSGQASCRSILQSPGEILLEKGLARTPLTQTSAADMVPAALKRSPTTNSRREARTRGYTEAESQVTRKRAPLSERQRKEKEHEAVDGEKSNPPQTAHASLQGDTKPQSQQQGRLAKRKGSCNPLSKGRGRGIAVAPERIPQCTKKKSFFFWGGDGRGKVEEILEHPGEGKRS